MQKIYHYNSEGKFTKATTGRPNPLEAGQTLVPANATLTKPPALGENEAAVYADGVWSKVADHVGTKWWSHDGTEHLITKLGELPPPDTAGTPLPPPDAGLIWNGTAWVPPPKYPDLETAKLGMEAWIAAFSERILPKQSLQIEAIGFAAKEAAARAQLDGSATAQQTALLQAEADLVNELVSDLVAAIIEKADLAAGRHDFLVREVAPRMAGLRRKTEAVLASLEDPYEYEATLVAAETEAINLAVSLGLIEGGTNA